MQGFPADWTESALEVEGIRRGHRWKLVGNAVSAAVSEWIGNRLANPTGDAPLGVLLKPGFAWPHAAWGTRGRVYSVDVSSWPVRHPATSLRDFLAYPRVPLSYRAAAGFLARAKVSSLHFEKRFLEDVERHVERAARFTAA